MFAIRREMVCAVACAMTLSACSVAPIVRWQREGAAGPSGTAAVPGASMDAALRYLGMARAAYGDAVADQMAHEARLSSVLVGTGALVAILAASTAHRDAVFGTAALGGTAYALGNMNLRRTRVLTYQAGVEALNCAQRAVIPFDISPDDATDLAGRLDTLDIAHARLAATITQAEALSDGLPARSSERPMLQEAIAAASQMRQTAGTTLASGRQFLAAVRRAARELVAAVDRIDAAVARSVIDSTPDLSNVPKVIGGLAGMMGSFAPGAGIEARAGESLARLAATPKGTLSDTPVQRMVRQLDDDARAAASAVARVSGQLTGRALAWPEDAFKDCGVAQVVTELSLEPAALNVVPGSEVRRVVRIAGGVKPYFVEFDGPVVEGVVLKPPVRFDDRLEVGVSSKVAGTHRLTVRVIDSSPTAKVTSLSLTIAPAASAPTRAPVPAARPTAPPVVAPAAGSASIDRVIAKLKDRSSFVHAGKNFVLIAAPARADATTIALDIACPSGSTTMFTQAALAASLLGQAGVDTGLPRPAWRLRFKANGACLAD
jgi:hypothetical protein